MEKAWLGVDAGIKNPTGLTCSTLPEHSAALSKLIDDALLVAEEVVWAVDQPGGGAALLLALQGERNQRVLYASPLSVWIGLSRRLPWRVQNRCPRCSRYRLPQARMRSDLTKLKPGEQEIAELQLLLARRRDLVTDQSRTITRLREALLSLFPALERVLDLISKGPLTLLTHYQTPAQLRQAGHKRIAAYLRNRGVKGSDSVAHKALAAARSQSVTLPAQEVASRIVAELAAEILALKERIESIDEEIGQRFFARPEARILTRECQAWDRSSGPSSWLPWAMCVPSLAPTGSTPMRVSFQRPVTLGQAGG